jgi:hypothetical protein
MQKTILSALSLAQADPSFEAVYLFSLLGLMLTLAFPQLGAQPIP